MIVTVTCNPSVDYVMRMEDVTLGGLNRAKEIYAYPGGKGINVARVCTTLGAKTKALGFVGGFTGAYIRDWVKKEGIQEEFLGVEEMTRINVKVKHMEETELNGTSGTIPEETVANLQKQLAEVSAEDIVVFAGSLPDDMKEKGYKRFVKQVATKKAKWVLDTNGPELIELLPYQPLLIKPNHHELAEAFGVDIASIDEAIPYAKELVDKGAQHVIVSFAGQGALCVTEDKILRATAPKGTVKNSVGAGDSLVAGFLTAYQRGDSLKEAFRQGVAAGSATAFSNGFCTKEHVAQLKREIVLT
ncbi:1-phosphofructokinase [Bacillus fonticola]|uniref:1-phosphofructokinase n=1 Tax=Bacillus fonticola TaxID=2728853 RepID=UPI001474F931|nr:1-phosphofructokinase [Bacillus fonticola]